MAAQQKQEAPQAPDQQIDVTAAEWLMIIVTGFTGVFAGPFAIVPGIVLLGMFTYRVNPELMKASAAGQWVRGFLPAPAPDLDAPAGTKTLPATGQQSAPAATVATGQPATTARVYLSEIATALNVAIIGPKGSGKTTTMQAVMSMRPGYVEALDPHNEPGKWPCAVYGGGEQFHTIHAHLLAGFRTMRQRYGASNQGERSQATYQKTAWRVTFAGDEWAGIVSEIPDVRGNKDRQPIMGAGALLGKLIARGRKVGIGMLIATHDDTAAQFGLAGEMGLVDCFDWLIYLGGQATGNTAIPVAMRQAAQRMERPALALDTERRAWYILMLDNIQQRQRSEVVVHSAPGDYAEAIAPADQRDDSLLDSLLAGVQGSTTPAHLHTVSTPDTNAVRDNANGVLHTSTPHEIAPIDTTHTGTRTPENETAITPDEMRRLMETARLIGTGMGMTAALCKAFDTTKGSKNPRYQRARCLWEQAGGMGSAHSDAESDEV